LCNIIGGTPDTKMDGSSLKYKKVVSESHFITHTFNVKHGTGALCMNLEYREEFQTKTEEILTITNVYYHR
jgi:hypothetical protein